MYFKIKISLLFKYITHIFNEHPTLMGSKEKILRKFNL